MSDKLDVEKVLAKHAKNYQKMAVAQVPATVGTAVLDLIRRDGDVSRAALLAEFEQRLSAIHSSASKGRPELDLRRLLDEEALAASGARARCRSKTKSR